MGMFSWVCKGCGHELCENEHVLLNGVSQQYDGYGGSAADAGDYSPVAWHTSCYQLASTDEKNCQKPSHSAPNQGFGPSKLEFKQHAKLDLPTQYSVDIDCGWTHKETDKYVHNEFVMARNGRLVLVDERGNSPERWLFDSLDHAIATVDALLGQALPPECRGEYEMFATGWQDKAFGCVYHRHVHRPVTWAGNDYTIADEIVTEVLYDIREREARIRKKHANATSKDDVRSRLTVWEEPLKIVEELLSATDTDNSALMRVRDAMVQAAGKGPANVMGVKEFPWMCGNCGQYEIWSMRKRRDNKNYQHVCDNCGEVWT